MPNIDFRRLPAWD